MRFFGPSKTHENQKQSQKISASAAAHWTKHKSSHILIRRCHRLRSFVNEESLRLQRHQSRHQDKLEVQEAEDLQMVWKFDVLQRPTFLIQTMLRQMTILMMILKQPDPWSFLWSKIVHEKFAYPNMILLAVLLLRSISWPTVIVIQVRLKSSYASFSHHTPSRPFTNNHP